MTNLYLRFAIFLAACGFVLAGSLSIAACVAFASGWRDDREVISGAAWGSGSILGTVVWVDALLLLVALIDSRSGDRS